MTLRWFAAKTLYRTTTIDADRSAAPGQLALIEERIVLLKAQSFDDAIAIGEASAREYANSVAFKNRQGDLLETKYLESIDVFELADTPTHGAEIFSGAYVTQTSTPIQTLLEHHFGPEQNSDSERELFVPVEPA